SARRAHRRDVAGGDAFDRRAAQADLRLRAHHAGGRARHGRRLHALPPHHRPAPGPRHRPGRAAGDPRGPGRARGISRGGHAVSATNGAPLLRCSDLHAYYGESYILQGVSFEVRRGEIFALLGRNGAGKTTTLRAVARAGRPRLRRGDVVLEGGAITSLRAFEAARRGVSLVPEDRRIIPGLTVEENLKLAQVEGEPGWSLDRIYRRGPRPGGRRPRGGDTPPGRGPAEAAPGP